MTRTLSIVFAILIVFAIAFTKSETDLRIIKIDGGNISGSRSPDGDIHIFKGIPFAAPPVGDMRWKAPQPVKSWPGVKECNSFGPSPMQAKPVPFSMWSEEFLIPKEPISEDCLYLNIWTGAKSAKEKKPVLVWIYGGGFVSGGSAVPIYDGEAMAKKGIVFVSINYRVGLFGFFAHPELTKESGRNASGNYALMDQIAALQWIKKNISAFGGDPGNITIAGQSAGSFSVNCLVASPLGRNLFQKAIGQSGASFSTVYPSLNKAEEEGMNLAKSLKAESIADLRKVSAEDIMQKSQGLRGPIIDGYVLPASIANTFADKKENKVALLTGWNEDEGLQFAPPKNAEGFKKEMNEKYGEDARTALEHFPASNDAEAAASQLRLSRDQIFGTQNYIWANMQSDHGAKVYVYRFTRKVPGRGEYARYGAFHTGEVPYAYDNLKFVNRPWETIDHELAKIISAYWANFARSGNPNGKGLPQWEVYNTKEKKIMLLGEKPVSVKLPDVSALDFLIGQPAQ
jgi:para-nitrobenzyl esterase